MFYRAAFDLGNDGDSGGYCIFAIGEIYAKSHHAWLINLRGWGNLPWNHGGWSIPWIFIF